MNRGEPVIHMYIIFIVACLAYGAWSLYKHVEYLEETIRLQDEAIEKKSTECELWKQSYYQLQNGRYQQQLPGPPRFLYPQSIIH